MIAVKRDEKAATENSIQTVYFDACVYNHLVDASAEKARVIRLKEKNKIEIVLSEYLIDELVATYKTNGMRAQQLFQCVRELMSDKILKQRKSIIGNEVNSFLRNTTSPSEFFNKEERATILQCIDGFSTSGTPLSTEPLLKNCGDRKKERRQTLKQIINNSQPNLLGHDPACSSFECFYSSAQVAEKEFLEGILNDLGIKNVADRVKINLNNLPFLQA